MTTHAANWKTIPVIVAPVESEGTAFAGTGAAAGAAAAGAAAGMSGMSGMSATSPPSAAGAAGAAAAPGFFMPNLPEGRTAPGRAILRVLRCVSVGDGAAAAGWDGCSAAGSAAGAGAAAGADGAGFAIESGRLMRIVLIGAASFYTGATPSASEREMRAVLDLDACFCASVRSWSAMMPVLRRIACWGIS